MKTKKDLRKPAVSVIGEEGRAKKLVPEKKIKSHNRVFIDEIEDDDELDEYFNFKERESIEDYFDDEDDFDDELDEYDDED